MQRMKQLACAAVYIRRLVTKQPKNYMYVGNVITSGSFPQKGPCAYMIKISSMRTRNVTVAFKCLAN